MSDEQKRKDSYEMIAMMTKETGEELKIWGSSIVGFGTRVCRSERTGREVDWPVIGFSPRKANISLYLSINLKNDLIELSRLGKHETGVGCLYINKLADFYMKVLKELIANSVKSSIKNLNLPFSNSMVSE